MNPVTLTLPSRFFNFLPAWARNGLLLAAFFPAVCAYAQKFNLDDLPVYRPGQKVTGTIRCWGNDTMVEVMKYWEEGFKRHHPEASFEDNMATTAIAIPALSVNVADIGVMGREVWPIELISYLKVHGGPPVTLTVAGGTFDVESKTWALTIFVHKDNPIAQLTMEQLDGIFGGGRTGGWNESKSKWIPGPARSAEKNIRTWGQLGLTGEWKDKLIQPYGFDLTGSGFSFFFAHRVFDGGDIWNDNLKEFVAKEQPDGKILNAPKQVTAALAHDRYGIAFDGIGYKNDQIKVVAIAPKGTHNYIMPTLQTVQNMTYPLSRSLYMLAKGISGKSLDPKVKEFFRYILSREGQEALVREGDYLPLPANVVREQLKKLE